MAGKEAPVITALMFSFQAFSCTFMQFYPYLLCDIGNVGIGLLFDKEYDKKYPKSRMPFHSINLNAHEQT